MTDAGTTRYPHLFRPTRIGTLTARNAVKYAACSVSNFNHADGSISRREMGRMEVICRTGAGLITNQGAYPDADAMGKAYARQLSIADDRFIDGFAKIADLIHAHDAIAIQQILHGGRYGGFDADHCLQASDVPQTLRHFRPPRALSKEGIRDCIRDHAVAARRALKAGFDGVEVTAFMGYLLANFLSSFTNDRSDEYGGSVKNRARFMIELIDAIKQEIQEKIFWVRLNGEELMDDHGGSTPDECIEFMRIAEEAGVDGISIVVGWHESRKGALGRDLPSDQWLPLADRARAAVKIPLAFGPRFGDPLMANEALGAKRFDFWEVCRPFLADPDLLRKTAEDRVDEVRPCIGGLICLSRMFRNLPYLCAVNPRLGHEYDPAYAVEPAPVPKRVLVIGGGPAGMECALAAARRGHDVTLVEKSSSLGGQMRTAAFEIEAGGDAFARLIASFERQLEVAGVKVELNVEATTKGVRASPPDVAVVATGATFRRPDLPGADLPIVAYGDWTAPEQVPGDQRIVVLGLERSALVLAEHLAAAGRHVTVVGDTKVGYDVAPTFKWRHAAWIEEYGVKVVGPARVERIAGDGVYARLDDEVRFLPADRVVVGGPRHSVDALFRDLEFSVDELYVVGDAVTPRAVQNAVHEGFQVGNRI